MIYANPPHYNLNQNLNEHYQSFDLKIKENHRTNTFFALVSLSLVVTSIALATLSLLPYIAILATVLSTLPAAANFYTTHQFCNMLEAYEAKDWDSALKAYNSLYDQNHALPFFNQNYYVQINAPNSEIPTQLKQILTMNLAVKEIYGQNPNPTKAALLLKEINHVMPGFHPTLEELQVNNEYYEEFIRAELNAPDNLRMFQFLRPELIRNHPSMTLVEPEEPVAQRAAEQ